MIVKLIGFFLENIAVVVLTYNSGKLLEKNIFQYMDLLGNVSLYVLDNHFLPENSYFGVEEICSFHDNLHYYRHPVNLQFHGNLIRWFEIPTEDYIVLLSDEDFLCPGWYEDFHQIVSMYPNLLAARPSILGESGDAFYGQWDSHIFCRARASRLLVSKVTTFQGKRPPSTPCTKLNARV